MRRWKHLATAAVLTGSVVTGATLLDTGIGSADPPSATTVEHCVVRVIGRDPNGQLKTTELTCSPNRVDALRRAGAALTDFPLGIHFDGPGLTGSSFTVVGADCTGGWLNLNAAWTNHVSSTQNGCPRIRHFDGYNLGTPAETTVYPGGNLITLDNRTNSIQYLP
jgi:hypothetical protein